MPNVKFKIKMDNRVKPGLTTRNEVLANLRDQGIDVQAADPVFDATTGKLIQLDVHLPEASSAAAKSAIDANSGVSGTVTPIPEPLFVFDLENVVLADTVLDPGASQDSMTFDVFSGTFANRLGTLRNVGAGNVFTDQGNNTLGRPFFLVSLFNAANTAAWTLPAGDVTLTYDGAQTLVLANAAGIVVDSSPTQNTSKVFYVATDGKMYLQASNTPLLTIPGRTFEEAVAAGAV